MLWTLRPFTKISRVSIREGPMNFGKPTSLLAGASPVPTCVFASKKIENVFISSTAIGKVNLMKPFERTLPCPEMGVSLRGFFE
jgi:hypothetical protein